MSDQLRLALDKVIDPELRRPITELGMVGEIDFTNGVARIEVKLTVAACPARDRIERDVVAAARTVEGVNDVSVSLGVMTAEELAELRVQLRGARAAKTIPFDADSYTRVYLVGSGKGGVGKSSLTANLAVQLALDGFKVGLLDADVYGFSIPGQLGLTARPTKVDEFIVPPVYEVPVEGVADGDRPAVRVISIGMFIEGSKAVAWRGPMLHRTMQQFLADVHWGDLDFLLVDLPPGTGDVAISLGQLLPTAKSIVVTTPQAAAADISARTAAVGLQTGQGILGVIENLSWFEQQDGSRAELFGAGGGQQVAAELTQLSGKPVELLGQVPFSIGLREGADAGSPIVVGNSSDTAAQSIAAIAKLIAADKLVRASRSLKLSV
ncbi:MAG: P-loop NTPase [Micrococcales bacterium]